MDNIGLWYRRFGAPGDVLELEQSKKPPRDTGLIRVKMQLAPVNASDLIPVTGAYRHRVNPNAVAGYEGVGKVIETASGYAHLLGKRVLPLRGQGTWQQYVDCDPLLAISVPENVEDTLAARAYINPLAALLMLQKWDPVNKHILITAAGSACATLIGQWAVCAGAKQVTGLYRSDSHARKLQQHGIIPLAEQEIEAIEHCASRTDIVYDAVGGLVADRLLRYLSPSAQFVSYGLLSGQPFLKPQTSATVHWFHIRHYLDNMPASEWQALFADIWSKLRTSQVSDIATFPLTDWRKALAQYYQPGRQTKPLLQLSRYFDNGD